MGSFSIQAEMVKAVPDYKPLAGVLLGEIRQYFEDPEHEAEYQAWLKERRAHGQVHSTNRSAVHDRG